jgi:hypothetical protein
MNGMGTIGVAGTHFLFSMESSLYSFPDVNIQKSPFLCLRSAPTFTFRYPFEEEPPKIQRIPRMRSTTNLLQTAAMLASWKRTYKDSMDASIDLRRGNSAVCDARP